MDERLGIAGSGAIACGLARTAAPHGEVTMWARSPESAERATQKVGERVRIVTDLEALGESTFLVEAVAEDPEVKTDVLRGLCRASQPDAILSTTTSSLSIETLADGCAATERFVGLHVFNPVPKMALVELAFPQAASPDTRSRAHALCEALGKTAVEVPDVPGFVVNRLLFPYLFSAVDLLEETGMEPKAIDACMRLGAGHPMGPLALLDFVGLDVAIAIGESIGAEVPQRLYDLAAEGALGRKAGRGLTC